MSAERLVQFERELAVDMARADLECYAAQAPSPKGQMPRYNVLKLNTSRARYMDPDYMHRCIKRAVVYLHQIGAIHYPVPDKPQIVAITREFHIQFTTAGAADCLAEPNGNRRFFTVGGDAA